ncbi:DUF397 domain-containing protein [Streptomyces sp. NPDC102406]|uniref:DUF397 domain-containing protein n=1 Tax=Streptomyces sp. NPDC102406 TaxID=3366171 RepID=UPI003818B47E
MSQGAERARSWRGKAVGPWRRSSYSGVTGDCVEVAFGEAEVWVRDSGNPGAAALVLQRVRWQAFVRALGGPGPGRAGG